MTTGELAGNELLIKPGVLLWTTSQFHFEMDHDGGLFDPPLVCDFFDVVICPKDDLEQVEDPRNMWQLL